jgi:predicted nucleic acid-binding protein
VERQQAGRSGMPAAIDPHNRSVCGPERSTVTVYLDPSSLVKLYVTEVGSDGVRELADQAAVVATSIVAYAETRATLARLRRSADLTPAKFAAAKREFERQWPSYLALEVTALIIHEAGDFAERYALRGFDALHLASFADIARRAGSRETRFSSFDDRLNQVSRDVARRLEHAK